MVGPAETGPALPPGPPTRDGALVTGGDFLLLDPSLDHKLFLIQEQVAYHTIRDDDFESYKGSRWMLVDDMQTTGDWAADAGDAR